MAVFISLADTVLEESYYLEALPSTARCRTCGDHLHGVKAPDPPTSGKLPQQTPPIPPDDVASASAEKSTVSEYQSPIDPSADHTCSPASAPSPEPLYRCTTCGVFVECRDCCLERHALSPLHAISVSHDQLIFYKKIISNRLQEWDYQKSFWRKTSLRVLGQSYQLGHDGYPCVLPVKLKTVTVLHVNGIHRVSTSFCGCSQSISANPWQQAMRTGWYPNKSTSFKGFPLTDPITLKLMPSP